MIDDGYDWNGKPDPPLWVMLVIWFALIAGSWGLLLFLGQLMADTTKGMM